MPVLRKESLEQDSAMKDGIDNDGAMKKDFNQGDTVKKVMTKMFWWKIREQQSDPDVFVYQTGVSYKLWPTLKPFIVMATEVTFLYKYT